jgi:cytochrome c oxidase subunit II
MRRRSAGIALVVLSSACVSYDRQSALDPAGPQAASIHGLWMYMLITAIVVYVAVMAALVIAVRGKGRGPDDQAAQRESKARRAVQIGVGVAVGIALVTIVADFAVGRGIMHGDPMRVPAIKLTGHQWWWEVEYEDSQPQQRVLLANEIHIPVGTLVKIDLVSHDVIHSFWAPNLGGKKDLIPGHDNAIWLRADRPGVYRATCAEFCGLQHAKMALFVVAEPQARFAAWMAAQRTPAREPTDSLAARGRAIFETGSCAVCHTVAGTRASGRVGPNLTHVASRLSLAAGTLHNTRGNLAGWIVDPQTIKPGAQMPPQSLSTSELRALLAYLGTLR